MQYNLTIRPSNVPAHLDIEKDLERRKNGNFTFVIRVNAGNIVDYSVVEYVNPGQEYQGIATIVVEELTITRNNSQRGE